VQVYSCSLVNGQAASLTVNVGRAAPSGGTAGYSRIVLNGNIAAWQEVKSSAAMGATGGGWGVFIQVLVNGQPGNAADFYESVGCSTCTKAEAIMIARQVAAAAVPAEEAHGGAPPAGTGHLILSSQEFRVTTAACQPGRPGMSCSRCTGRVRFRESRHGNHRCMSTRRTAGRVRCWQLHQGSENALTASGFVDSERPPQPGKDFLGAAVTLAIIGAIVLQVTNRLASQCGPGPGPHTGPGACSGLSAIANHVHGVMTLGVVACAALTVIAFVWYMFWGYKINSQIGDNQDT
jgi:hypothetical protein